MTCTPRVARSPSAAAARRGPPVQTTAATPGPDRWDVVLRWLDLAAIAGLIGALGLTTVCVPLAARRGAEPGSTRNTLAKLAVVSGVTALCTGAGLLVVQAGAFSAVGGVLARTSYGTSWIVRELLIAALLVLALALRRGRPAAPEIAAMFLGSFALCGALALNSHSASAHGHLSIATLALAVHLLAAALWAGGVGALVVVLIRTRRNVRVEGSTRILVRSFASLAVPSVAILAITGVYSAGVDVASMHALVTTLYGRTLLAKTALFVLVGAIGLANSRLVRSRPARDGWLRHDVGLEAGLAAGVVFLAAMLTATAPARESRYRGVLASAPVVESVASAQAGDLLVSLSVKPNAPGPNFVTAGVFDTRRPAPAPIRAVELAIDRRGNRRWREASRVAARYWQVAGARLARPGPGSVSVRIQRQGLPAQVARIPWTVKAPHRQVAPQQLVRPETSLAHVLSPVAAVGLLVLAAALAALWLRQIHASGTASQREESLPGMTR
jgi:copper transport protein